MSSCWEGRRTGSTGEILLCNERHTHIRVKYVVNMPMYCGVEVSFVLAFEARDTSQRHPHWVAFKSLHQRDLLTY